MRSPLLLLLVFAGPTVCAQYFVKSLPIISRGSNQVVLNSNNAIQLQSGDYLLGRHSQRTLQAYVGPGGSLTPVDLFMHGVVKFDRMGNQLFADAYDVSAYNPCFYGDEANDLGSAKQFELSGGKLLTVSNFFNFNVYNSGNYQGGFSVIKWDPSTGSVIDAVTIDFDCQSTLGDVICNDVAEDSYGNIYLTGFTQSYGPAKCLVIKLDHNLGLAWSVIYENTDGETRGHSICLDQKNNRCFIGGTFLNIKRDSEAMVLSLNLKDGTLNWCRAYGGSRFDNLNAIQHFSGSGLIFLGSSKSFGFNNGRSDFWLTTIDYNGRIAQSKTYGGDNDDEAAGFIWNPASKLYVLGGHTQNGGYGGSDMQLMAVTASGSLKWGKLYGSGADEYLSSIANTLDKGLLFWGNSGLSTGYLYKTDANGIVPKAYCSYKTNSPVEMPASPASYDLPLDKFPATSLVRHSYVTKRSNNFTDQTVCLNSSISFKNSIAEVPVSSKNQNTVSITPLDDNRFTLHVPGQYQRGEYGVFSSTGQLIMNGKLTGTNNKFSIDLSAQPKGVYLLKTTWGQTFKLVVR